MGKLSVLVINCCLGSLFVGFCSGQMNIIAQDVYEAYGVYDTATKGLLQSLMTIGGAVGAFFSSVMLKLFSRKNSLQVTDLLSILSISLCFLDNRVHTLMFSRFLIGLCLGLNQVLVPLYINEMCPPSKTGIMGTFNQLLTTVGVLTCFLFGYFQQSQLPIEFYKIILLLPIVPCALRMLALETLFNYETPAYCNKYSLHDQLTSVLKAIYEPQEMVSLQEQIRHQPKQTNHNKGSFQNLLNQRNKKRFILGCSLAIVQQLGGINGIMYYSSQIFDQLTNHDAKIIYKLNIIVGLIGVLTSILIGTIIGKFGRKQILQYGQLLCFVSLQLLTVLMTMSFSETDIGKGLIIFLIFLFLFGFGSSLGPLLFIYLTEILPEQGVSFAAFLNWFCAGVIAQMFPIIASYNINYCFAIFSLFNFAGFILISTSVVETKGLTEIEIQKAFDKEEDIEYCKTPQEEYIN